VQGGEQYGQEDADPLIGFTLSHTEQAPLHHLEGIRFEIDQDEEQSIFWRWEGTVLVHAKLADGPGFPIEAPHAHMRLERGLKGRDQALKLVQSQAGEIEELCWAILHVNEP
jgi:hypothetical protein